MTNGKQQEPCFRMYLGRSNWVNLNSKTTADLIAIFKKGLPCRYTLAPGLHVDILPNDVDCNSRTTELPNLMRADLCYDAEEEEKEENKTDHNTIDDDKNEDLSDPVTTSAHHHQTNYSSTSMSPKSNFAEYQEVVQQTLSRFIKDELEKQGIVDVFPPTERNQPLPHVYYLAPHRHLSLVAAPTKISKRVSHHYHPSQSSVNQANTAQAAVTGTLATFSASTSSSATSSADSAFEIDGSKKRKRRKRKTSKITSHSTLSSIQSSTSPTTKHKLERGNQSLMNKVGEKSKSLSSPPYNFRSSTARQHDISGASYSNAHDIRSALPSSSPTRQHTKSTKTSLTSYDHRYYHEGDQSQTNYEENDTGFERPSYFSVMEFMSTAPALPAKETSSLSPSSSSSTSNFWYANYQQQQRQQDQHRQQTHDDHCPIHLSQLHQVPLPSQALSIFRPHQSTSQENEKASVSGWELYNYHTHYHHQHHQHDVHEFQQERPQHQHAFDIYSSPSFSASSQYQQRHSLDPHQRPKDDALLMASLGLRANTQAYHVNSVSSPVAYQHLQHPEQNQTELHKAYHDQQDTFSTPQLSSFLITEVSSSSVLTEDGKGDHTSSRPVTDSWPPQATAAVTSPNSSTELNVALDLMSPLPPKPEDLPSTN